MATAVGHLNDRSERARTCLRNAAACERAAVLAIDPATQATYRDLAKQWREMVNSYKDLDRLRGVLQKNGYGGPELAVEVRVPLLTEAD